MPHLEENLRYATTREQHCLQLDQLAPLFPIMRHPSLEGCHLGDELRHGSEVRYRLVCASPSREPWLLGSISPAGAVEHHRSRWVARTTFSPGIEAVRQRDCEPLQRK